MRSRSARRAAIGAALTAGALAVGVLASATPASAHVTVNPREAEAGGYARVDFRVPNESDTESTTELEVHFPEDAPIASVSIAPVPGWSAEVTRRTLDEPLELHDSLVEEVVETITWTADDPDAQIEAGEFLEFPVSMGPLPEVDQLAFPSLQTYSDGEVVRWIEVPEEGAEEPANPAPVLTVVAADEDGTDPAGAASDEESDGSGADGEDSAAGNESAAGSDSGSDAGTWLGLAGLVAGLAGLALGGIAFARTRAST